MLKISLSWVLCFERRMRACGKQRRFRASCDRLVQSTAKCELSDSHFAMSGPGVVRLSERARFCPFTADHSASWRCGRRQDSSSASARQQPKEHRWHRCRRAAAVASARRRRRHRRCSSLPHRRRRPSRNGRPRRSAKHPHANASTRRGGLGWQVASFARAREYQEGYTSMAHMARQRLRSLIWYVTLGQRHARHVARPFEQESTSFLIARQNRTSLFLGSECERNK